MTIQLHTGTGVQEVTLEQIANGTDWPLQYIQEVLKGGKIMFHLVQEYECSETSENIRVFLSKVCDLPLYPRQVKDGTRETLVGEVGQMILARAFTWARNFDDPSDTGINPVRGTGVARMQTSAMADEYLKFQFGNLDKLLVWGVTEVLSKHLDAANHLLVTQDTHGLGCRELARLVSLAARMIVDASIYVAATEGTYHNFLNLVFPDFAEINPLDKPAASDTVH